MCVNEHFIARVFQDMLSGVSFITILGHVRVKMSISKNILGKGCPGDDFKGGKYFLMVRMEGIGLIFSPVGGYFQQFWVGGYCPKPHWQA